MLESKKVALFCRATDEYTNKLLHDYAEQQGFLIIPIMFTSEQELLDNPREDYDAILTTETIMLPITNIEIIKVTV